MSRDRLVGLVMLAIALAYVLLGWELRVFVGGRPGAGFFPLILTSLLAAFALSLVLRPGSTAVARPIRTDLVSLGRVFGIIALTVLMMPYTGYLVAILVLLALTWLPNRRLGPIWGRASLMVTVTLGTYFLFYLLMGVPLPKSKFGF